VRKRSRRASLLLIAMALTLFTAGCGSNWLSVKRSSSETKETVHLKIMFQKNNAGKDHLYNWMQDNIRLYTERNPHVHFDVIATTCCENYLTVLTTGMAANNIPDIFQGWTLERMRPFADAGRLMDMTEIMDRDPEWSGRLSKEALKGTTFEGRTYGLPLEMAAEVIFYNKDVFQRFGLVPPKTYDDFLHIVKILRAGGVTPMTVPNREPWVGTIPYMMILERIGGLDSYRSTVLDKTGKWTDEPFVEAARTLQELIRLGAFDENVNSISTTESGHLLAEGKAGMYAMGTWSIASLSELMKDRLGFFNFPDMPGGKGSRSHYIVLPNSALSISANTKHPEEAVAFLKFVFSQERQLEYAKLGYLTAYKTKTAPGDLTAFHETILEEVNRSTGTMYPWDVPLGLFMGKEVNNTVQALYTGADPIKVLSNLQEAADSLKP
jgi:raffinose/stachyose/melibiose transport system substrate-binding protein